MNYNPSLSTSVVSQEPIEIGQLTPGGEEEWDRFVTASPSGTFFHLSGWKTVIERVLGRKCFYLTARQNGSLLGIFPISWVRSKIFGECLVSLPLGVYGGVCADDAATYSALLSAGGKLASELGVKYLEMRNRTEQFPSSLPGRDLYVTFTQDLSAGPEKLLQALPRDTRYMVRKSLKAGLDWTEDLTLEEFYDLYARSVHRLGTPVFSKKLFTCLRSQFGKECRLFGVRKGGKAIAGVLCFYFRDQVIPYYSGSLPEFNRDAPNNFMYWKLMAQSCEEGYRYFDFGRSKRGTGAYQFKESWGMQMSGLPYRYQLVRATEVPHISPVDKKFQLSVSIWKQLPFGLTKILGPTVIRWIPSV